MRRRIGFMIDPRLPPHKRQLCINGNSNWMKMNEKADADETDRWLVKERASQPLNRSRTIALPLRTYNTNMVAFDPVSSVFEECSHCGYCNQLPRCLKTRVSRCDCSYSSWDIAQRTPLNIQCSSLTAHKGLSTTSWRQVQTITHRSWLTTLCCYSTKYTSSAVDTGNRRLCGSHCRTDQSCQTDPAIEDTKNNDIYSLKWRLTDRYLRWGTLTHPRPGRAEINQCKLSEFLHELRISGFPCFGVSPTCLRAKLLWIDAIGLIPARQELFHKAFPTKSKGQFLRLP